jgi:hypothetical protein
VEKLEGKELVCEEERRQQERPQQPLRKLGEDGKRTLRLLALHVVT